MSDRYQQLVNTPIGKIVSKQIGLPNPVKLERYERGQPVVSGPVLLGAAPGGRLAGATAKVLAAIEAEVHTPMLQDVRTAAADAGLEAKVWAPDAAPEEQTFKALVFDASGIADSTQLNELWAFFGPTIRRVRKSGRVIVLGTPPADCKRPRQATAQRALEGFVRSVGKEVRKGATAQLIYVGNKAESQIESTLRFYLSPKSAYVSGQVVRIGATALDADGIDWDLPLSGRFALVTGASRGIGRSIAKVLARDGAHVIGLDVPALESELEETIGELGGSTIVLDITDDDAPARIASYLLENHGGVDVVVHNAGVTRDKTLGRMDEARWDLVLQVNLTAQERINEQLLTREAIRQNGRIVCVSSMSGIAGNAGQTNYATSKAGVIGMVESTAPQVAKRGLTINAVAPGFIETQMTAAMPIATREAGRRMNSLAQGGLPVDVAETIAWFASPATGGVNGNVVRVCGQSLVGA
ncbi:MAG TPA: 3-oxoacyl-ACP reductase [Solirubrobacteraceae bacterium]|nr:3-oxoacyl-ACP reductase [Solirubrobacteraceae bacterium]